MDGTTDDLRSAAKVLTAGFTLSLAYELYRATAMAGTSRHDSMSGFVAQLPTYAVAALVIGILFARRRQAAWIGLVLCAAVIVISITYYNPVILLERQPGLVDWTEDLVFTGLHFVAATRLLDHLRRARVPGLEGDRGREPEHHPETYVSSIPS